MPALVETRALPDWPGCVAYQITGLTPGEVQAAIFAIMENIVAGEVTFRHPERHYSVRDGLMRWRARGYVRSAA